MIRTLLVLLLAIPVFKVSIAQPEVKMTAEQYIAMYQQIAVSEMLRTGIPASIKLAQGLYESSFGNSDLAKKANNHFGIKCGGDWKGPEYYKWDDDPQQSCFRVFNSAEDSYVQHSEFLLNRTRYAFLFSYANTDYKNWASGLKKAGYATNPEYPQRLIGLIERYQLSKFDQSSQLPLATTNPSIPEYNEAEATRVKKKQVLFADYKKGIFKQNGASYVVAKKGESSLSVAARFGISYKKLLKFNDLEEGDALMDYQYVYIEPKKLNYDGPFDFHEVKEGESIYLISQYYGVRVSTLRKLNYLKADAEPKAGEKIYLMRPAPAPPKTMSHAAFVREYGATPTAVAAVEISPTPVASSEQALFTPVFKADPQPAPAPLPSNPVSVRQPYEAPKPDENGYINTALEPSPNMAPTILPEPAPEEPEPSPSPAIELPKPEVPKPIVIAPVTLPTPRPEQPKPVVVPSPAPSPTVNPVSPQPSAISTGQRKHVVAAGETLYRVSKTYNVSVESLQKLNKLKDNTIRLGQELLIP
jgi:LysM repeat protein